jgi:hypothetical protein
MRHNILCLLVAVLAAVACFILIPLIGFVWLRIFHPEVFLDDTFGWMIFFGAAFLAPLVCLSLAAGVAGFFQARKRLP